MKNTKKVLKLVVDSRATLRALRTARSYKITCDGEEVAVLKADAAPAES